MALGPIVKVFAQAAVMGVTILLRAIPAAYGAALQNARKSGVDAAAANAASGGVFSSRKMALDEALMVLNLESKAELDPKKIQQASYLLFYVCIKNREFISYFFLLHNILLIFQYPFTIYSNLIDIFKQTLLKKVDHFIYNLKYTEQKKC